MTDEEPRPPTIRLGSDALVVLAGPSGSGKSTWAAEWFRPSQVVSSDELRGVVGEHVHDLRASTDAFAVLDLVVERRLARGLLTVVDTLGMDRDRHERWLAVAAEHGRPTHLVRFATDAKICRSRNRARPAPVPAKVLTAQLATWDDVGERLGEGFDHVHEPAPATVVARAVLAATPATGSASGAAPERPTGLSFGLQISAFDWPTGTEGIGDELTRIVGEAERAGFDSVWVMDHLVQIPQVGREWDPMLEAYTTLGYLAATSERIELGAMVTCITHRSVGLLGRIVATLDVLSGGRAWCGLGIGWYEREHRALGLRFPPVAERYELLDEAIGFLRAQWGPGSPAYEGRLLATPEAIGYPRPIRERVPILIGGSGERRTLGLVARHADACNLFGEPATIRTKLDALDRHCEAIGRDRTEIRVTQLSPILSAADEPALRERVEELRPSTMPPEAFREQATAATAEAHIDRFGALAEAGVDQVVVSLADVGQPDAIAAFAPIIDAFRP